MAANALRIDTEDAGAHALSVVDEPEQQMLRPDQGVIHRICLLDGSVENALRRRKEHDLTGIAPLAFADFEPRTNVALGDADVVERPSGDSVFLSNQSEQDVLGPDVVVAQLPRLVLRKGDDLSRPRGEPLEHGRSVRPPGGTTKAGA